MISLVELEIATYEGFQLIFMSNYFLSHCILYCTSPVTLNFSCAYPWCGQAGVGKRAKWNCFIFLFVWFTLKIHFFSFCKHLIAPDTSCAGWVIMLFSCLFRKKVQMIKYSDQFSTFSFILLNNIVNYDNYFNSLLQPQCWFVILDNSCFKM